MTNSNYQQKIDTFLTFTLHKVRKILIIIICILITLQFVAFFVFFWLPIDLINFQYQYEINSGLIFINIICGLSSIVFIKKENSESKNLLIPILSSASIIIVPFSILFISLIFDSDSFSDKSILYKSKNSDHTTVKLQVDEGGVFGYPISRIIKETKYDWIKISTDIDVNTIDTSKWIQIHPNPKKAQENLYSE